MGQRAAKSMGTREGSRLGTRRPRRIAKLRVVSRRESLLLGTGGIVAVVAVWQIVCSAGLVSRLLVASPWSVVHSGVDLTRRGILLPALWQTTELFLISFGISLVLGLALGFVLGWYRLVSALLDPWISILYAIPRIALIPLITVWVGVGLHARVVLVCLIATFPILINTASGVGAIDRDHLRLARSFLATNRDVLRTVALPGAIPSIVAGIRQGMTQGLLGVVAAEYFLGNTGIGGLIFTAGLTLNTSVAFLGMIVFAIAALALTLALQAIERRLDRWRSA
jgi:ABC-type nitrate/sulfonate/bicarbonate transport system permease component